MKITPRILFTIILTVLLTVTILIKVDGERSLSAKIQLLKNYYTYIMLSKHKNIRFQPTRFIAHAGGKVNNAIYTDSLESLNFNYQRGMRFFELDLQLTSDNYLVATHTWQEWKRRTNYKGHLPPSLKTFKNYKLDNSFTPLDIKSINQWFNQHPDTFLVTDKINLPLKLQQSFDKFTSNLLMELFSWKAFEQAQQLNLYAPIVTGNLLLNNDYKNLIKRYKVKYVAMSEKKLIHHLEKVIYMTNHGIKVYIFHLGASTNSKRSSINKYIPHIVYGAYVDTYPPN